MRGRPGKTIGRSVAGLVAHAVAAVALCAGPASVAVATETADSPLKGLDQEVQAVKNDALALNRDLFILEEELLFPANTQVAVYLSMDVGQFFGLDGVEVSIDGKRVSKYLYTEREVDALHRGGVQRLYLGNLKAGEHELVGVFTGRGPQGRDYRRATSVTFEKPLGAQFVELIITDNLSRQQPEFMVKIWD
jgi:hypothetical protein